MQNHDPLRSLFDLAFALLLVFVVISAVYMSTNRKYEEIIQQNMFRNNTQYVIGEQDLFNYSEYRFKDRKKALIMISEALETIHKQVLEYKQKTKGRKTIKSILIIGHTDIYPFSKSSDDLKKFNDELDKSRKRITSDVINKKKNVELYHKYLKIYNKIFNTELTYENIIKNDSISREVLSKIIERGKNTPTNIANNINEIIDNTKQFIEVKKIFDNKFTYEKASKNEEENSTN